jgi:uncharacterized membrane protein
MPRRIHLAAAVLLAALLVPSIAFAQTPAVHAILFYSPTCGHCEKVIQQDLPPLFETYGDRLQMIGIDVTTPEGQALFLSAIEALGIPEDRRVVPTLVVGKAVLTGSLEIPEQLPGLIEQGLAQGGVDWPAIPGLAELLARMPTEAGPPPTPAPKSLSQRVLQDPVGNSLAIVVLIGMTLSLVAVAARWIVRAPVAELRAAVWLAPLLAAVGLMVAAYLTVIELSGDPAVCGPVGDCNAVQQSSYAFLFGVPVGALGVVGYATFILLWAGARLLSGRALDLARVALFGMAVIGTLFSIYLTFLEPFVIGATCAWCLTSAILLTSLLWLTADPARAAAARLRGSALSMAGPRSV